MTDTSTGPALVPVPTSAPQQITTENSYAAFPITVRTTAGYLCSYKTAPSHNSHVGNLVHRRSPDGIAWGEPYQMPGQSAGYTWGHGGVAAETEAQGGRIYLLLLRLHWGTSTIDEVRCWAKWSDDDGLTWTLGPQFPVITGTGWYPSSVCVLADGSVVAAGYNSDGWVRYLKSVDRGATWVLAGAAKPADRGVAEGTLVQLDDGRLLSFLRSDVPDQRLYWTICEDISPVAPVWSSPVVATYEGSGLPNATVVDGGHIAVTYRGYSDITAPALGRPTCVGMFNPTDAGISGYRGGIRAWPAVDARYLYGNLIKVAVGTAEEGWRIIVGIEGPGGQIGGGAAVVSIPVELRPIP